MHQSVLNNSPQTLAFVCASEKRVLGCYVMYVSRQPTTNSSRPFSQLETTALCEIALFPSWRSEKGRQKRKREEIGSPFNMGHAVTPLPILSHFPVTYHPRPPPTACPWPHPWWPSFRGSSWRAAVHRSWWSGCYPHQRSWTLLWILGW